MLLDPYLLLWLVSFCTAVTRADFCSSKKGWVMGSVGEPVVLPCHFILSPPVDDDDKLNLRITWTKLGDKEVKVLQAHDGVINIDPAYMDRVSIPNQRASLTILRPRVSDSGVYQCHVFQGHDATVETLSLDVSGVCFHYRGNRSPYSLNFEQAKKACEDIDASIATPEQLLSAYEDGYEQCGAGWLSDQTVRYPIVTPRVNCESNQPNEPGVRNYGKRRVYETYDVYCCAAKLQGEVFYAGVKLSLSEASEECERRKAALASTGQLYAAWRRGMHRCDYGWLSDGSVRFPFSNSKAPCDEHTPGVRTFYRNKTLRTFPLPDEKFGAYCFTGPTVCQNDINTITDQRDQLLTNIRILIRRNEELNQEKAAWELLKSGWSYYKGSLYFFSTETKSWSDSRSYCRGKGADLVIINSKEENDFVKSKGDYLWIGLTDEDKENDWKWVDGSKLNLSFWGRGEPNNYDNEDCVRLQLGIWNDAGCSWKSKWICEKKMN